MVFFYISFVGLQFKMFWKLPTISLQVKVVIVDSVTFHFRQNFDDLALRTRLLSEMALKFMKLAKKFSLAVRINHLSL